MPPTTNLDISTASSTITPQRLEPSVSLADGSLLCAPLSTIVLATCDALYDDLYTLTNGTIPVHKNLPAGAVSEGESSAGAANVESGGGDDEKVGGSTGLSSSENVMQVVEARMSNLSYAQRRHELTMRISRHIRAVSHITALIASYCGSYAQIEGSVEEGMQKSMSGVGLLGECIRVADNALQHVFEAWSMADEAQDALYFSHGSLWNARKQCHDVYGAMDMYLSGRWRDIPSDVELNVDPYDKSEESTYSKDEVMKRLQTCVRKKLLLGEIGYAKKNGCIDKFPWENIIMEQNGGTVKLTYGGTYGGKLEKFHLQKGNIKTSEEFANHPRVYPIEARLTVMDESSNAQWVLLSLDVSCSSKTGESIHHLETNNRQKMNLHRLCARAMAMEEKVGRKSVEMKSNKIHQDSDSSIKDEVVARPLECLFDISHSFLNSLSLEILCAQAGALRRGTWGNDQDGIHVTSLEYFENQGSHAEALGGIFEDATAEMSIYFWFVDDRFGEPTVSDLGSLQSSSVTTKNAKSIRSSKNLNSNRLCLNIRAIPRKGIAVALSGGGAVMRAINETTSGDQLLKTQYQKLLSSVNDPFELSAADAILASSVICAQMRSMAVADALSNSFDSGGGLPNWLSLHTDCGSVSVNVKFSSHHSSNSGSIPYVELYRLACDSRTGRFVTVFPESCKLLRLLAANDISASSLQHIHKVRTVKKRKGISANRSLTGRLVKDAFDGLNRSVDVLGRKVGVGSEWNDTELSAASIRKLEIDRSCVEIRAALMTCSGIAAIYGAGAIALSFAGGIEPVVDITGNAPDDKECIQIPPLGLLLSQEFNDSEKKSKKIVPVSLKSNLFGVSAKVTKEVILFVGFEISTRMESPYAVPERTSCKYIPLPQLIIDDRVSKTPSKKRRRLSEGNQIPDHNCDIVTFASGLASTLTISLETLKQVNEEAAM